MGIYQTAEKYSKAAVARTSRFPEVMYRGGLSVTVIAKLKYTAAVSQKGKTKGVVMMQV